VNPPERRGPRPLLLHLTLSMMRSSVTLAGQTSVTLAGQTSVTLAGQTSVTLAGMLPAGKSNISLAAWMNSKPGSPNWSPPNQSPGAAGAAQPPLPSAIAAEAAFLAGIQAWRAHPWRRDLPDKPECWREGTARLLDYGGEGVTVLFVPSLVNRWTVLDLMAGHSMLRWLAEHGVHPLLLDWGKPEPSFTLTDHIAGRLVRAMDAARRQTGGPIVLAGYCMGGTFATAAAALRPDLVSGLVLLAAPWDFHAGDIERLHKLTAACATMEPLLRDAATVPVDLLQTLFALDDPAAVAEKFRRFGHLDQASATALLFVALEDWLNDGVPLSGTTARECLRDWYRDNLPMRGEWRVAGLTIDPASIQVPAFVATPRRDRIVPPESARPLARLLPNATPLEPDSGHVGMTAGRTARTVLWEPLCDWLGTIGGARAPKVRVGASHRAGSGRDRSAAC
jgi:polyhydroxyalkanoate synthase